MARVQPKSSGTWELEQVALGAGNENSKRTASRLFQVAVVLCLIESESINWNVRTRYCARNEIS